MVNNSIKYFILITIGYCIDFSIFFILVKLDTSVYLANFIGFSAGSVINTILIRHCIFQEHRFSFITDLQLSFASNITIFTLGTIILWCLIELNIFNEYAAKLTINGITFVANYFIRTIFFRKR